MKNLWSVHPVVLLHSLLRREGSQIAACVLPLLLLGIALLFPSTASAQSPCNQGRTKNDPRSPYAECIPVLGTMSGWGNDGFGEDIAALGRLTATDTLASWIIGHYNAEQLLIYHGVPGGLPSRDSGVRIGPTERNAKTTFLACGDWDADGNRDIALRIHIFGDTTGGNLDGWWTSRVVVYWGHADGRFSNDDTTQLQCEGPIWLGGVEGLTIDADNDSTPDLLIYGLGAFRDGGSIAIPHIRIFRGIQGSRWGRDRSRRADWLMWNTPFSVTQPRIG